MATRTWNGSAWDTLPVDGDTIAVTSVAATPAGDDLPGAGTYNFHVAKDITVNVGDFLVGVGRLCGFITADSLDPVEDAIVNVDRDFAGGICPAGRIVAVADITSSGAIICAIGGGAGVGGGAGGHVSIAAGKTLTMVSQGTDPDIVIEEAAFHLAAGSKVIGVVKITTWAVIDMYSQSVIQGLVDATGSEVAWSMSSTGQKLIVDSLASRGFTLNLGGPATGLNVEVETNTTGSNDMSIRTLHIGGGAIFDGKMQELTLATGIIMGAGTIHDWIGAAAYTAFGTIDGGLNENITFRAHPQQVQPRRMGLALVG